jgi:hypothetical protein
MICSSVKRFFTSNLLQLGDWTPNRCATQNRGDVEPKCVQFGRAVHILCLLLDSKVRAVVRKTIGWEVQILATVSPLATKVCVGPVGEPRC